MNHQEETESKKVINDETTRSTTNDDKDIAFPCSSLSWSPSFLFHDRIIPTTTTKWIDVTQQFRQCAQQLTPQRPFLCQEETFQLYDAMAASQLGHEKMDCCQVPPYISTASKSDENNNSEQQQQPTSSASSSSAFVFPRPPPTGLSSAFTPLKWDDNDNHDHPWTESQVLGFALQILVRLQALCAGASVGESTFTCLYAHAPVLQEMEERLFPLEQAMQEQLQVASSSSSSNHPFDNNNQHKTLSYQGTTTQFMIYALSLSLMEITKLFRSIVQNADIYEEEDFVAHTYQIPFFSSTNDILSVLATALQVFPELPNIQASLGCILSFLCGFYSSISRLAKLSKDRVQEQVEQIQEIVGKATNALDLLLLEPDLESWTLAEVPSEAFDPYVHRPRVGNAPIRQVRTIETRQAITILRDMTHEMDWSVCQLLRKANSLARLRRMLEHVSRKDVNILSRSLIVLNLYFEDRILGQFEMVSWIGEDLLECTVLEEYGRRHLLLTQPVHSFLQRLAKPIYDTFKLQTLNRNRQRAYMDVIIFPEWVSLQMEAQALDAHLCSGAEMATPIFTQYALVVVLRLMAQYIRVGFELDLYCSPDDIGFAYWYLDFLLSGLLTHLSAMKQNKEAVRRERRMKEIIPPGSTSSNSKGNQRSKKKGHKPKSNPPEGVVPPEKPTPKDLEMDLEMSVIALKRNLCRGSLRFLAALRQVGILAERNHAFTSNERIFEERFRAFANIRQPPPLVYEQYAQGSDFSTVTPEELQETTGEWFQSCKRAFDQLQATALPSVDVDYAPIREEELKSLLKVCIGNNVYLLKLRQVLQDPTSASSVRVEFDTKTHDQYCTIKLA